MELILTGIAVFIIWILIDRFSDAIDASTSIANNKMVEVEAKQLFKHRKSFKKIQEKISEEDEPVLSAKALKKIISGKSTYEEELAKVLKKD